VAVRETDPSPGQIRLRWGHVAEVGDVRPGAVELTVDVDGGRASALAYPELVGGCRPGDRVLLNTTAVALGLGTGGMHLVVAVDRETAEEWTAPGRVMKARYLPHQLAVRTVEETDREALEAPGGLGATPVVVAPLHSMVAPIAAGMRIAGAARVVYVMTDGAALPGGLSRLVPRLRDAGLIDTWLTAGQAFGGELEAVTVWSALLAAVHVARADAVIVADGPGNLGTDTTWGVSALGVGNAATAATVLGGRALVALRISFADPRERHRALSHHSLTMLEHVVAPGAHVAVPVLDDPERTPVWDALRSRRLEDRHQLVEVEGAPAVTELDRSGVDVTSMGRGPDDDPAFFLAAGAAGILAARMAAGAAPWRRGTGNAPDGTVVGGATDPPEDAR
jgi:Protein of unknown function (DUF3866)